MACLLPATAAPSQEGWLLLHLPAEGEGLLLHKHPPQNPLQQLVPLEHRRTSSSWKCVVSTTLQDSSPTQPAGSTAEAPGGGVGWDMPNRQDQQQPGKEKDGQGLGGARQRLRSPGPRAGAGQVGVGSVAPLCGCRSRRLAFVGAQLSTPKAAISGW